MVLILVGHLKYCLVIKSSETNAELSPGRQVDQKTSECVLLRVVIGFLPVTHSSIQGHEEN